MQQAPTMSRNGLKRRQCIWLAPPGRVLALQLATEQVREATHGASTANWARNRAIVAPDLVEGHFLVERPKQAPEPAERLEA